MSGKPRQFKVDFKICFTPLPAEKEAAYRESIRLLAEMIRDRSPMDEVISGE